MPPPVPPGSHPTSLPWGNHTPRSFQRQSAPNHILWHRPLPGIEAEMPTQPTPQRTSLPVIRQVTQRDGVVWKTSPQHDRQHRFGQIKIPDFQTDSFPIPKPGIHDVQKNLSPGLTVLTVIHRHSIGIHLTLQDGRIFRSRSNEQNGKCATESYPWRHHHQRTSPQPENGRAVMPDTMPPTLGVNLQEGRCRHRWRGDGLPPGFGVPADWQHPFRCRVPAYGRHKTQGIRR